MYLLLKDKDVLDYPNNYKKNKKKNLRKRSKGPSTNYLLQEHSCPFIVHE